MASWQDIEALNWAYTQGGSNGQKNSPVNQYFPDEEEYNKVQNWYNDRLANMDAMTLQDFYRNSNELIPNWTNVMKATGMSESELQALRGVQRINDAGYQAKLIYDGAGGDYNNLANGSKELADLYRANVDASTFAKEFGGSIAANKHAWEVKNGIFLTPEDEAKSKAAAEEAAKRASISNQIQEFANRMLEPVQNPDGTFNDPIAYDLARSGANAGMRQAQLAGIQGAGGLGATTAKLGSSASLTPYLEQRQQQGQQALGMLSQRDLTSQQLDLQRQQLNNGIGGANYNKEGGIISAITGLVGAVGGGVIGGVASEGNPAAIQAGMQIGNTAGTTAGQIGYQASNPGIGQQQYSLTPSGDYNTGSSGNKSGSGL